MRASSTDRCDFCGGKAVAFQHGASVCGQCGIRRTMGESPTILPRQRSRRAALVGAFSSGMIIKVMMGSVALAAVGSVAAASLFPSQPAELPDPTVVESSTLIPDDLAPVELTEGEIDDMVTQARSQAEGAHELAAAVQKWADCVSSYAVEHRSEGTNPREACGERPHPSEFGLGNGNSNRPDTPPGEERRLENSGNDKSIAAGEAELDDLDEGDEDDGKPEQSESNNGNKDKDKDTDEDKSSESEGD